MVEQVIESGIIEALTAALEAADVSGIQAIGAWQPVTDDEADPKGIESATAAGYLSVKALPRAFDTYTMGDGSIGVTVELNMRAEVDAKGADYLTATSALTDVLYAWHKSFDSGQAVFDIENEFLFTGFRLDGGDCGLDRDHAMWTWRQTLTIQGVFLT